MLVKEQAEAMTDHPTEFELMTAVALVHFRAPGLRHRGAGSGPRRALDSTIDAPEAAVSASASTTRSCGTTLAAIAGEKAGIVKPGSAVVSWPQDAEAMAVVEAAAAAADDTLTVPDFHGLPWSRRLNAPGAPALFSYGRFASPRTKLLGSYQPSNAALAIETAVALRERGWRISDDAVRQGVADAVWPGRASRSCARGRANRPSS